MDAAVPTLLTLRPASSAEQLAIARAATLNRVGTGGARRAQLTLAGENTPVRLVYGRPRIGARVLNVLRAAGGGNRIVVQVLWGFAGEPIGNVTLADAALPAGSTATHYDGTQTTVDATLAAAFAAQSPPIAYTDTLAGYCYSVIVLPGSALNGSLALAGVGGGRLVYDPRDGGQDPDDPSTWVWSDNPALCLADFCANRLYGAGRAVDWSSVADTADANDEPLAGGEPRRRLAWALEQVQPVTAVIEVLRTYAGCWVVPRGDVLRLVPDAPSAPVASYAHAAGQVAGWSDWTRRDTGDAPTVVEIEYSDTAQLPWRSRIARAQLPGAGSARPWRVSRVALPGITRHSQAHREAVERLNKLTLADLALALTVFDAGIAHEAGDVVEISLPFGGLAGKPMRLAAAPRGAGHGLWTLPLVEYDPAVYSDEVQTEPTYPDTTLPDPNAPPAIAVAAAEEVLQNANGLFASRARVTITPPDWPWIGGYRVEVLAAGQMFDAGTSAVPAYATPPLQEGVAYTIRAQLVSVTGAGGPWAATALTPVGKPAVPGDVPWLDGFEVGGDVYLRWGAAADLDIWRYEIRYGATGGSWDTATLVDRVDGLRAVIRGTVPAGAWKFWIKAVDSIGQLSAGAATLTLTVTLDPDALQTEHAFGSPTLTRMRAFQRLRGGPTLWVTDPDAAGDQFGTLFASPLATYTAPLATYHTSATSSWLSEAHDFGQPITGDWAVAGTWSALAGAVTATLQLSPDGSAWTDYTTLPTKQTARWARVLLEADSGSTLLVETVGVTVAAVTRKEFGTIACAASGIDTVTLEQAYSARRRIVLTPVDNGAAARIAVADAIALGTPTEFDVYLFDAAGNRVAGTVAWAWEGV